MQDGAGSFEPCLRPGHVTKANDMSHDTVGGILRDRVRDAPAVDYVVCDDERADLRGGGGAVAPIGSRTSRRRCGSGLPGGDPLPDWVVFSW